MNERKHSGILSKDRTDTDPKAGPETPGTGTGTAPAKGTGTEDGSAPLVAGHGHTEAGTEANGLGSVPGRLLPGDTEAELRARWKELQTAFVDGPKDAVEEADALVFDLTKRIEQSITARHRALRESWHGGEAGTEQYRLALRDYRDFVGSLLRL